MTLILSTLLSVVETSKEAEMYVVSVFNAAMTIIIMFGLTFFIDQAFAKKDRNTFISLIMQNLVNKRSIEMFIVCRHFSI